MRLMMLTGAVTAGDLSKRADEKHVPGSLP